MVGYAARVDLRKGLHLASQAPPCSGVHDWYLYRLGNESSCILTSEAKSIAEIHSHGIFADVGAPRMTKSRASRCMRGFQIYEKDVMRLFEG